MIVFRYNKIKYIEITGRVPQSAIWLLCHRMLLLVRQQLMGQMFIFIKKKLQQKHTEFFAHA